MPSLKEEKSVGIKKTSFFKSPLSKMNNKRISRLDQPIVIHSGKNSAPMLSQEAGASSHNHSSMMAESFTPKRWCPNSNRLATEPGVNISDSKRVLLVWFSVVVTFRARWAFQIIHWSHGGCERQQLFHLPIMEKKTCLKSDKAKFL